MRQRRKLNIVQLLDGIVVEIRSTSVISYHWS